MDRRGDDVGPGEWLRWLRLTDREGLDPVTELIAVADCLPPAALKLVGGNAPVSSLTWIFNLLRANADYAHAGSSSQQMNIWNAAGEPVAEQMQSVAVFA